MMLHQLTNTVEVFQREYGIAAVQYGHERIITTGVTTCTIWVGWDPASGVGFLAHFDYAWTAKSVPDILDEVSTVARSPYNFQSTLWGGKNWRLLWSQATRQAICNEIIAYKRRFPSFGIEVAPGKFHSGLCQVGYGLDMKKWKPGARASKAEVRTSFSDWRKDLCHLSKVWEPMKRAPFSVVPADGSAFRSGIL